MSQRTVPNKEPIRVLHVLGGLGLGGIETWLMHVLRNTDRAVCAMDFVVHSPDATTYVTEAEALGATVHWCPGHPNPYVYGQRFRSLLRTTHYDVVHSHLGHYDGLVLNWAKRVGVRMRIAHSHNDTRRVEANEGFLRARYRRWMRQMIIANMTAGLACSHDAAECLFVTGLTDPRVSVLPCGIDLDPFLSCRDTRLKATLGRTNSERLIVHIGRFVEQKNHRFLLNIMREVVDRDDAAHLLLIGEGPLFNDISEYASQLALKSHVTFLGARRDIPSILMSAADVFLFPSLHEGLGLVVVEAQAANVPCVISDTIPAEAAIVPDLIQRISLNASAAIWAEAVIARINSGAVRSDSFNTVKQSAFNIHNCVRSLLSVYGRATQ